MLDYKKKLNGMAFDVRGLHSNEIIENVVKLKDVINICEKIKSPVEPEVKPKIAVKNSSDFVKETAEQYGTELFNKLNDYEGFQSWCGKNNIYKANAEQLKQYFIKKICEALTEYESNFST